MQPGTRLGPRYVVDEHVADRDDGSIWHGRDTERDQPVRIKILSPELSRDPAIRTHFRQSTQELSHLAVPGLLNVHECVEQRDGDTYVVGQVSDRVVGTSLRDKALSGGSRDSGDVLNLVAAAAGRVHAVHQAGVRQLWLTPDSFVVGPDDEITLVDVGFLPPTAVKALPATTLAYAAPEIIRAEPGGVGADVYSLGAIAAVCLTGVAPEDHKGPPLKALNDQVAPAVSKLVTKALSEHPPDRFVSAASLATECRQIDFTNGVLGALLDRRSPEPASRVRGPSPRPKPAANPPRPRPAESPATTAAADHKPRRRRVLLIAGGAVIVLAGIVALSQFAGHQLPGFAADPYGDGADNPSITEGSGPSSATGGGESDAGSGGSGSTGQRSSSSDQAGPATGSDSGTSGGGGSGGGQGGGDGGGSGGGGGDGGDGGGGSPDDPSESDEPDKIEVPDVTGQESDKATRQLKSSGFKVNLVEEGRGEHRCDVDAQSPEGGRTASEGSTVDIHVKLVKNPKHCDRD